MASDTTSGTTLAAFLAPTVIFLHVFYFKTKGLALSVCLATATFLWVGIVSHVVPEPYLDEVFHIPQAQKYCQGRFSEWDDKITTPPGLYWISILLPHAAKASGLIASYRCDAATLRATNAVGLMVVSVLAAACRREMESRPAARRELSGYAAHTALNVALFPLLFFFSGLYYTDVVSTAAVLAALLNHLVRVGRGRCSLASDALTACLGILCLVMRQTNVFWVAVFMGGSEAVHAVKSLRPERTHRTEGWSGRLALYAAGEVHDLPLDVAQPEDMALTVISLVVAAVCNPARLLRQIWPYLVVLSAFAGFVGWNGGVVLGDKSNHVATIHLAQMLYVWAFFAFFSLPLFVPCVVQLGAMASSKATYPRMRPWLIIQTAMATGLSVAVVRYNTIIHPFTLADNRHYMFYVFRYTIRRAAWIRYALILPYTVARWLVWATLAGFSRADAGDTAQPAQPGRAARPVPTSTCLIFLLATTLSLVTAPLVEPRYFIVPWVVWRLMVPAWRVTATGYDVRLVLETLWFLAINVATGYIFLYKPYMWRAEDGRLVDEGRLQRFMW